MKFIPITVTLLAFLSPFSSLSGEAKIPLVDSVEAASRVAGNKAVLVDVREPEEWEKGVAAPAHLLPLSDLRGERKQWAKFLRELEGKEVLLYCRRGNRSGVAAAILAQEGFRVRNAGSFREWQAAKLPERKPQDERKTSTPPPASPLTLDCQS